MTENFPLPTSYKYGKVVGRVIHAVADTPEDPDALPQARPASGKVVFTPAEKIRKVVDADYPAIAMHETFESTLNSAGRITDSEGRVGIWLLEGVWRVSFNLDAGNIESYDIQVTDQHTDENPKDIISDVPYTPPSGVLVTTMLVPSGGQPGQTMVLTESGGTEVVWADVPPGQPGQPGRDGTDGDSAYEAAVANGFVGTEAEWLASLKGEPGQPGRDGTDGTSPPAPNFSASAETLAAGASATAQVSGVYPNLTLSLGIPQGEAGAPGTGGGGASAKEVRSAVAGDYSYMGTAPLDTLESAASWKISRIALTGAVGSVTTATGAAWDNRESEVYS